MPSLLAYHNPSREECPPSQLVIVHPSLLRNFDLVGIRQLVQSTPQSSFALTSAFARIHGYDGLSSFLLQRVPSLLIGHLVDLFTIVSFVDWFTSPPFCLRLTFFCFHEPSQRSYA